MKKLLLGIALFVVGLIAPTVCIVKSIKFDQQCAGYLKQVADANTPEIALDRITVAIDYVESNNLTEGCTSVLWRTEDENIGFWYQNLLACKDELTNCVDGTQLEKSNVLMKVRESLTDNGEKGTRLTIPGGISRYPHNQIWGILRALSYLLLFAGFVLILILLDEL